MAAEATYQPPDALAASDPLARYARAIVAYKYSELVGCAPVSVSSYEDIQDSCVIVLRGRPGALSERAVEGIAICVECETEGRLAARSVVVRPEEECGDTSVVVLAFSGRALQRRAVDPLRRRETQTLAELETAVAS